MSAEKGDIYERLGIDLETEAFSRCFLQDVAGCLVSVTELHVKVPRELEEERCIPVRFYQGIVNFTKPFLNELLPDILGLPVLFYFSPDFFTRFTNLVCMKLKTEDEQISFLKGTAFIVVVVATAFISGCFRFFYDVVDVYYKLLRDHLKTRFYKEKRFDEIMLICEELLDDEQWISNTTNEMRRCILESCEETLEGTEFPDSPSEQEHFKSTIYEVRNRFRRRTWDSNKNARKSESSADKDSNKDAPQSESSAEKYSNKDTPKSESSAEKDSNKDAPKSESSEEKDSNKDAPKSESSKEKDSNKDAPKSESSKEKDSNKDAPKSESSEEKDSNKDAPENESSGEKDSNSDEAYSEETDSAELSSDETDSSEDSENLNSRREKCIYCGVRCIVNLQVLFQPQIMYKPCRD